MAIYYPQGVITLRVLLEDFGFQTKARLQDVHTFTAVAKQLNVNLNSYREADTFSCTLDFKNFPFDPRAIRTAAVSIHVEDRKQMFKTNNSLNLIEANRESVIFLGYADTDKISLSEDNRTVMLEGRDFTSLLLDRPYFGSPLQLTKPLDKVFQELLNQLDETKFDPASKNNKGLEVINNTGAPLPVLAKSGEDKTTSKANAKNARPNRSYWDMIQKTVNEAGLVAYISLDKLIITTPRILYGDSPKKIFVYGGNIKTLDFERKLGRQKNVNVRVLSTNITENKVIDALIPKESTEEWAKSIGIKREEINITQIDGDGKKVTPPKPAPYISFKVNQVKDKNALIKIGEKVFEEVGRQQIEGSFETKEMQICDTADNVFNSTQMRVGTPIEIDIRQGDLKGMPRKDNASNDKAKKAAIKKFLIRQCYDPTIADAFAESLSNFNTPFFTQAVEFNLDQESGWSMKVNFINFINLPRSLAGKKDG